MSEIVVDFITEYGTSLLFDVWKKTKNRPQLFLIPGTSTKPARIHDGVDVVGECYDSKLITLIPAKTGELLMVSFNNISSEMQDIFNNEHSLIVKGTHLVTERFPSNFLTALTV